MEEELMESDVMDAEGSVHQKPRDVCDIEAVMDAGGSQHQKPRDVCAIEEVMNDEGSLHQKTNEVCIMEDAESIDLAWFENTKLNRVKNSTRCLLHVGVRDWESLGTSPSRIQKRFGEAVAEVMDATSGGTSRYTSRPRSSRRISILTSMNFFGQVRILSLLQFSVTVRQVNGRQYVEDIP